MAFRLSCLGRSWSARSRCLLHLVENGTLVRLFRCLALITLISTIGCSTWSATTVSELPLPQMPYDSIVLEAAFVRVPPEQRLDELWSQIDEQHVDAEKRRALNANGIRCGVAGTQLPTELQELLEANRSEQADSDGSALISDSVTSLYRTLQNRSGERSDLIVVPEIAERKVILFNEDRRVRAETFDNGQALFAVRAFPNGDGTVRVELVPEVRYGDAKHQWAPGNGTFLHDHGRETKAFDLLRTVAVLSPGQTLLVTGTDEPRGLGSLLFNRGKLFHHGKGDSSERLVLLLRLAQTQYDDLFAPEQSAERLATPLD